MPMCAAMPHRRLLVWRHSALFLHLAIHPPAYRCMITHWIMATIIYHLIMVLTILSLLFTQQANRTIIKRAAYYTSNLYDPNIKTFNRVNYEAGFDINFLHNRLGLSATAFEYSSLQPD